MDFSKRQADPRRHLVGMAFVALLHVAIVYALVTLVIGIYPEPFLRLAQTSIFR